LDRVEFSIQFEVPFREQVFLTNEPYLPAKTSFKAPDATMTKRILVVEDRDDSRTILVTMLSRLCGYETIAAANGTEAIEKAISEKPDLILMDLDLPDISGIDAARAVKGNPNTAHIPIIAQTAWNSRQWKTKVLKIGMVDYLEKPVSIELIKATIEKFIGPSDNNDHLASCDEQGS
jgi:two-component system, cell cycle response regulator DivK